MRTMGSSDFTGYCSFTKAIEHLGERWSLLILRELGVFGAQGFNELATGLPGRISRSVLADRLRKLEDLGPVSRTGRRGSQAPYRLTTAGHGLLPTIMSIRGWASTWIPEDPAVVECDPDILLGWLARRVDPARLPDHQVVLAIRGHHPGERHGWLVLKRGTEPYGCRTDPLLNQSRYVYVAAVGLTVLLALAHGRRSWADAIADESILAFGDPDLTRQLAGWFQPAEDEQVPDGQVLR